MWKTLGRRVSRHRVVNGRRAPWTSRVKSLQTGRLGCWTSRAVSGPRVLTTLPSGSCIKIRTRVSLPGPHSPSPQARSADDPDLLVLEALLELLQQVHRPGDAGRGESLDGARREASFELASAQQHFEAVAGEGHPDAPVVLGVGCRLDQALGLEPLDERRGRGARHAELGRDVLGAGSVRAA